MLLLQPPAGKRHRSALMALVGAAAVVAVGVFVVVLLSPASDHPSTGGPADTIVAAPVSTLPGLQNAVPAVALAAGRSMVELQATTSHGIVALIGIAVAEGGLVVTTADALGGLEHLSVVGPGGTLAGRQPPRPGPRLGRGPRPGARGRARRPLLRRRRG